MVSIGMFWLAITACSGPQMINGTVKDIWNAPIQDAGLRLGDHTATTNAQGRFSIEAADGLLTVAKGGYIPDEIGVAFDPEVPTEEQTFNLFPKPDSPGFHAVGDKGYIKIEAQPVEEKTTTHKLVRGLRNLGDVKLRNKQPTIVYHAEIRKSEVMQLKLRLHKLEYLDSDNFLHIQGKEKVHVGLNIVPSGNGKNYAEDLDIQFNDFPIDDFYKITFSAPLAKGSYAFHTDKISIETSLENNTLAKEFWRAYPFDIRK